MILVTVELIPYGDYTSRETLAEMRIINDGTGSIESGNYRVESRTAGNMTFTRHDERVEDYQRLERPVLELLEEALDVALKNERVDVTHVQA